MKKLLALIILLPVIFASCTKDNATITMTFRKGTAIYANIDDIRNTELVSGPRTIENAGKLFIGEDFILIGESGEGIHVLDNSNPANPTNIEFINLPFTKEFYVEGTTIYAESQYDLIKIDLSDLHNPALVDRLEYAFAEPLENDKGEVLVGFDYEVVTKTFKTDSPEGQELKNAYELYYDFNNSVIPAASVPTSFIGSSREIKGTLNKIAIANNHIYVVSKTKLHYFENSPTSMISLGSDYLENDMETVFAENNRLYIGTMSSMIVMDITNPAVPHKISNYRHPNSCDPVLPHGNVAYLTLRTADYLGCSGDENTLDVLDITDINNPEEITTITMTSPYGMAIINNQLYVGEGENGLSVFDVSNPANPVLVQTNNSVVAYDILEHPTEPNRILTTSDFGLRQYEMNFATMQTILLSEIAY